MSGRVAIVTGGGSGLGATIAARFAADGDHVVLVDNHQRRLERVRDEIASAGGSVEGRLGDVTRSAEIGGIVDDVRAANGRLDVLVCSAAIETRASVADTSDEDWQRVLDVNLKGPFLCMRSAIPHLVAGGGGSIVLMSSILGAIGTPGYAAYCASKGALNNLAKQAAVEHAADGVRVNVVAPSATEVGLFMELIHRAPDPDAIVAMVAGRTPMKRLGHADEVAATVAFLCSEGAGYITGAIVPVDGGMAARRIV